MRLYWEKRPFSELMRLAWPLSVSMISYTTMTLADTAFVGSLGTAALAGVGLAATVSEVLIIFSISALQGSKLLISQCVFGGRPSRVRAIAGASHALALLMAVVVVAVGQLVAVGLPALADTAAAGEAARSYLSIRILGTPLLFLYTSAREVSCGQGIARPTMIASVASNALNVALDYVFIIRLGWGVGSAAAASAISSGAECAIMLTLSRGFGLAWLRQFRRWLGEIWSLGFMLGLQGLAQLLAFLGMTILISLMAESDMAAYHVAMSISLFAFLPLQAISEAVSILVGQAMGAGRIAVVRRLHRLVLCISLIASLLWLMIVLVSADSLVAMFSNDPNVAELARQLLILGAVILIPQAANFAYRGLLRGLGDVRYPAAVSIGVSWATLPPLTWLLGSKFGLGAVGAWTAIGAEVTLVAILLGWRLRRLTCQELEPAARSLKGTDSP